MKLSSPAFKHGEPIPKKYTCDGENMNPPLVISDVPEGTQSLVLIVDDPDAPGKTWVHWVIYNINPEIREIPENAVKAALGDNGKNDFGKIGYGGPCPPPPTGSHTYKFKLYALDIKITKKFAIPPSKQQIESDIKGNLLATAELDGEYQRS